MHTEKLAIVMPAMNEEKTVGGVVEQLKAMFHLDVIVVDDASSDKTATVARNSGAIVISHVCNLGAWRATQTGIRFALKHEYSRVITCDADGQHTAESIRMMMVTKEADSDCLIGACTSRGSKGRHVAWRFFRYISGLAVTDLTSGLRSYSKNAMQVLASRQATMFEYQDVGVLLMLKQLDMKVRETEVDMKERLDGISRIFYSWLAVFRYLIYTLVLSLTKLGPLKAAKYRSTLTSRANSE